MLKYLVYNTDNENVYINICIHINLSKRENN